jgi:hypothetical protein
MGREAHMFQRLVVPLTLICITPPVTAQDIRLGEATVASNGEGTSEEGPEDIRDNAFLVEEAFNQEPGVAQHIFNWIELWDRPPDAKTRDFAGTYTMELPLGSQRHQFSFTSQFLDAFEKSGDGAVLQQGGVGDTLLNYRYQLLADDEFLWIAPRITLIVPTGDERFGLGTGEVGYQFNLPISRYGDRFDFHFNAGATYTPDVAAPLPIGLELLADDLNSYNLGASAFWKPQTYLHFFVEGLYLSNEGFGELATERNEQMIVNPGVRYAICQFDDVEWVVGAAVPVGLNRDAPDIGAFAYMSIEHVFRRVKE